MSIHGLKTKDPWMIMSKDNCSLVQVVTPPQYYDWCAAVWSQCPLCLGTADSRLGPRSPRLQAPAAACSRGAAACRGLQQPAAGACTGLILRQPGHRHYTTAFNHHYTISWNLLPRSNIFPYFKITFMFISSVGFLFLALQYQGSSTSNSSNSSFLKTLGLPPGPLGKSLQYMCRTLSPSRSPATLGVKSWNNLLCI